MSGPSLVAGGRVAGGRVAGGRMEIEVGQRVAGLDPEELVGRFGSPLFVYDLDVVSARVAALRAVLPPGSELAFAVKANPSLAVVAHLAALGLGADVASGGELALVLAAGLAPRQIVFTGPAKSDGELRRAVEVGIGAITIESLDELDRLLAMLAAERDTSPAAPRQGVMLRLAIENGDEARQIIGDGGAGKFGLTPREVDDAARRLVGHPDAELRGIHAFGASNVLDPSLLVRHVRETVEVAATLGARRGFDVEQVDVGGGLGIPYADGEAALDLDRLGSLLSSAAASWQDVPQLRGMRLVFEPGRYLVGPAGAYLTRVVATKVRGRRVVTLIDGGIHHLARPALVRQEHRIRSVGSSAPNPSSAPGAPSVRAIVPATVAGPLCTGLDILTREVGLPDPRPGDVLAVLDVGAYGYTESMPLFLSHPAPAEVAVLDGEACLIRPRIHPADVLAAQLRPW